MSLKFNPLLPAGLDLVNDTSTLVVGPSSATDNAIALFNGTTGKLVKDSAVLLSALSRIDKSNKLGVISITRVSNLISEVELSDGRTLTVTRSGSYISSITDGTTTWAITRDANNFVESVSVS